MSTVTIYIGPWLEPPIFLVCFQECGILLTLALARANGEYVAIELRNLPTRITGYAVLFSGDTLVGRHGCVSAARVAWP